MVDPKKVGCGGGVNVSFDDSPKLKFRWLSTACESPTDFVNFYEERLKSLFSLLAESAQSLSQVEKYMMASQEQDYDSGDCILEVQQQLTDLEAQMNEDKRNYLDVVGEYEQLKLENEDLKRKFQAALLLGKIDEKAVTHLLQKNPKAPSLTDELIKINEELKQCDDGNKKRTRFGLINPVVLEKQVATLEEHLDKVKKQHQKEVFSLRDGLERVGRVRNQIKGQYESRLKKLVKRLEGSTRLLHKTTEQNIQLQNKMISAESEWNNQNKRLVSQLGETVEGVGNPKKFLYSPKERAYSSPLERQLLEKLTRAELDLLKKDKIVQEYDLKIIKIERRMHRAKEEQIASINAYSGLVKKLILKNEILEKQKDKIDDRRKMDNAGFREDIKSVKQLIATIEKKLNLFMYRVTQGSVSASTTTSVDEHSNTKRSDGDDAEVGKEASAASKVKNVLKPQKLDHKKKVTVRSSKCSELLKAQQQKNVDNIAELNNFQEEMKKVKLVFKKFNVAVDHAKTEVNRIENKIFSTKA